MILKLHIFSDKKVGLYNITPENLPGDLHIRYKPAQTI
jgi:hypothetical protein